MLIWVLQSSQCSKIRVAQHWGRRGVFLSENKGEKSECTKFSKKLKKKGFVSTIIFVTGIVASKSTSLSATQSVSQSVIEKVSQSIGQ